MNLTMADVVKENGSVAPGNNILRHSVSYKGTVQQMLNALRYPIGSKADRAVKTAAADELERLLRIEAAALKCTDTKERYWFQANPETKSTAICAEDYDKIVAGSFCTSKPTATMQEANNLWHKLKETGT